jgi:hypothetical protein
VNLTTATPVEIDTALYAAYVKTADLTAQQQRARQLINVIDDTEPGSRDSRLPSRSPERRAELVGEIEALQERIQEILQGEIYPREAKYHSRRWTRYYLVDNTNGHVHKDQDCKTCFPDTRYAWLVEHSGMTAEDLVELAGEKACTVCFPWAPADTLKRKSRLEAPERKAARLEREAEQARKAKEAADKNITTPEGEKLYAGKDHDSWDVCKTLRTAEIAATDALLEFLLDQARENDPEWAHYFERRSYAQRQMENTRHAWYLIRAIANKKGLTFQEVFETHEKKAQAKHRKIEREWAKDTRNPNRVK